VAHGAQRGLVDDVRQLCARGTRRHAGDHGKVAVGAELDLFGVQTQNAFASLQVGQFHGHTAVKTAGAGQGGVQRFGAVGGGQNDNALGGVKAVHLGQKLVQGLLALIVDAHAGRAVALFADGINFVNKYDAGCFFVGLLEQVAHLAGTHAHEHFHKFTAGNAEKRHARLAGHGAGQQRFACARRAYQQHALGHFGTDILVLFGVVQKVHDFLQALLGLVFARYIVKFYAGLVIDDILLGARFAAEQHRVAAHAFHALAQRAVGPPEQQDQGQEGNYHVQQRVPDGGVLVDRAELHARVLQTGDEVGILRDGVGFVRLIVVIHKVNLLILDLDGL